MSDAVTLRPLARGDVEDVLAAFLSTGDMQRQGDVRTAGEAMNYVERLLGPDSSHCPWAVVDETNTLRGLVVVSVDEVNLSGWFWYWMHVSRRGRGWTSRAAATVANWALGDGGLHRLELGHRANNPASRAVALAAGFVQEGVEREKFLVDGQRVDVLTYGRVRSDPVPSTVPLPTTTPDEGEHHITAEQAR
ncbi:GNAT family protein [Citricoccus sp.]|uniref:GNAT family N-acetyltransferase n=1 Tax=Citricoccus sp. TaxID=1978372 RepID=UPI0028BEA1D9|nr:GNAT family protein [Citricoccus sp.]